MKKTFNKLFLLLIFVFCFFVELNSVEASDYFKLCEYDIAANGDITSGNVKIYYDSFTDKFKFDYNFKIAVVSNKLEVIFGGQAKTEYKNAYGYNGCKDVPSSDFVLDGANQSIRICVKSPEGNNKYAPYVRFEGVKKNLGLLTSGTCPKFVDYTAESWSDKSTRKRICFGEKEDTCSDKLGKTWDDHGSKNAWQENNAGDPIIERMKEEIITATANVANIDIDNISNKNKEMCVGSNLYDKYIGVKLDDMYTGMRKVTGSGDDIKFYVYDEKNLKFSVGNKFFNKDGEVDGLIKAIEEKFDDVDTKCAAEGITKVGAVKQANTEKALVAVSVVHGSNQSIFGETIENCTSIKGTAFYKQLQKFFSIIKIATPILTIVLIMKDMISAVVAGKEDDMKKAQKNSIIRLIVGVCIFLLPTLINVIVSLVDEISGGTCDIK